MNVLFVIRAENLGKWVENDACGGLIVIHILTYRGVGELKSQVRIDSFGGVGFFPLSKTNQGKKSLLFQFELLLRLTSRVTSFR